MTDWKDQLEDIKKTLAAILAIMATVTAILERLRPALLLVLFVATVLGCIARQWLLVRPDVVTSGKIQMIGRIS
jgi:hypothetical protein